MSGWVGSEFDNVCLLLVHKLCLNSEWEEGVKEYPETSYIIRMVPYLMNLPDM